MAILHLSVSGEADSDTLYLESCWLHSAYEKTAEGNIIMSNLLAAIEAKQQKTDIPEFKAGDTVRVHAKIIEGDKERVQVFEGAVISRSNGKGNRATFTVRKVSYGVGVERIFPLHSPRIEKIEILARGKVRRAKLYYLRERSGKAARIKGTRLQIPEVGATSEVIALAEKAKAAAQSEEAAAAEEAGE